MSINALKNGAYEMILSLFRKKTDTARLLALYGAIVAQSRQPLFYTKESNP